MLAVMGAHALLETARDALFLTHMPARKLPLAYFAIAVLAFVVSRLNLVAITCMSRRALLAVSLLAAAAGTALFWRVSAGGGPWAYGALYVWTGLVATVLVVQLWLQIGEAAPREHAPAVFAAAGAGALVGALIGSLVATALLAVVADDRVLIAAAAATFALAAPLPLLLGSAGSRPIDPDATRGQMLLPLARDRYLARLVVVAVLGAVLVTGSDYLFKSTVAAAAVRHGWQLGPLFARFYAVVNGVSLIVQLLVVPRVLARGPERALLVLPALVLLSAAGFSLTLWIAPALMLKAADGTLRHSLHRTAVELMYLPLSRPARERMQAVADTVGQRGGQALASLMILGLGALPLPRALPLALTAVAAAWLFVAASLRSEPERTTWPG
jgi:ATP:ADP antiporter, AAA family